MVSRDPLREVLTNHQPGSIPELRTLMDEFIFRKLQESRLPEIGEYIENVPYFEDDGAQLTLDVLKPRGKGPFPVLVFLHGGGFVFGSSKSYQQVGTRFADRGYLVFNPNYRLAPEHPFPTGFLDCTRALEWVAANAGRFGGDEAFLAVAGDSAGGNFAAGVAIWSIDEPAVSVDAALLIYSTPKIAVDPGQLGPKDMPGMLYAAYSGGRTFSELEDDWRYCPILRAEKLPPTQLVCGTMDGLLADSHAMAQRLAECGVEFEELYLEETPHAFLQFETDFPGECLQAYDAMAEFLSKQRKKKRNEKAR